MRGAEYYSLESLNIAEVELVPFNEDIMCITVRRGGIAPPGSKTASRIKGYLRDLGDPTGSVRKDGGAWQGKTGAMRRAEVGNRTDSYYL